MTDPTSAAIAGASVSLTSETTQVSRQTVTDSAGYYNFPSLPIGRYQLSVDDPGFHRATSQVNIDPSEKARLDVGLTVGETSTSVEVVSSAPGLARDDASIGSVIENPVIENTPLLMRNWDDLIRLVPGVQQNRYTEQGGATASGRTGDFQVNGVHSLQNDFLLDGIDDNTFSENVQELSSEGTRPSVDVIQEFKVITNPYSAEYGRSPGAVVDVSTHWPGPTHHDRSRNLWWREIQGLGQRKQEHVYAFGHRCNALVSAESRSRRYHRPQHGLTVRCYARVGDGRPQSTPELAGSIRTNDATEFFDLIGNGMLHRFRGAGHRPAFPFYSAPSYLNLLPGAARCRTPRSEFFLPTHTGNMDAVAPLRDDVRTGSTNDEIFDPPVWTVVLAGICAFLNLYATQPILPMLANAFHVQKAGISLTVTASTLGVALSAPFMGRLADRSGRRRVILSAALLLGVTSLLAATSATLVQLIFWRFLQGVFTPGVFAVTVAYINDEWTAAKAGFAMSAYVSGTVVGGFCGRAVSGFISEYGHWRLAFIVLGLADLAMTAAVWRWLPNERLAKRMEDPGTLLRSACEHLRNRALLARYGVGFCVLFSLVATFTYVTFYLAAPPFLLSPARLGLIFAVYLVGAAATPIAGKWLDRFGSQRMLIAAALLGMTGVLLTLDPHLWAVAAGLTICCTGVFIAQAAVTSSIGSCAKTHRALAVGLYVTFYYLGGSAGATLPAWTWKAGGWAACVSLVVAVQAITLGSALFSWGRPGSSFPTSRG